MTPYFRYLIQVRPSIVQKNPHLKSTEIVKLISQEWEKADAKIKKDLDAEFKKELDYYTVQKMKYDTSLTEKQKADIKQVRLEKLEAKERRKQRKRMKELGRPKKPPTSFVLFMNSKKTERGDVPFREWQLKMSKEWENMPQEAKDKYTEQAKKEQELWREKMVKWEEQMIRLGNMDVVRTDVLLPKMQPNKQDEAGPSPELFVGLTDNLMDWDTRARSSDIVNGAKKIILGEAGSANSKVTVVNEHSVQIRASRPDELLRVDNTSVQNKVICATTNVAYNGRQNKSNKLLDDVETTGNIPTKIDGKTSKNVSQITSSSVDSNNKISDKDTTIKRFVKTAHGETNVELKIENDVIKSNQLEKNVQDKTVDNAKTTDDVVGKTDIKEKLSKMSADDSSGNIIKKYYSHVVLITFVLISVATYLRLAQKQINNSFSVDYTVLIIFSSTQSRTECIHQTNKQCKQ